MDVDLPPSRILGDGWPAQAAVRYSPIMMAEALHRHQLTEEEFLSWQRAFERRGLRGLQATRIQEYREPRWQRKRRLRYVDLAVAAQSSPEEDAAVTAGSPTTACTDPSSNKSQSRNHEKFEAER